MGVSSTASTAQHCLPFHAKQKKPQKTYTTYFLSFIFPSFSFFASFFALHQSFAAGSVPSAFDIFRMRRTCENSAFIVPLWLIIQTLAFPFGAVGYLEASLGSKWASTLCEESGIWIPSFRFRSTPVPEVTAGAGSRMRRSYCQSSSYPLTSLLRRASEHYSCMGVNDIYTVILPVIFTTEGLFMPLSYSKCTHWKF